MFFVDLLQLSIAVALVVLQTMQDCLLEVTAFCYYLISSFVYYIVASV